MMDFHAHHPDDITSERILQMKGILIEPGKAPEVTSLPDTLQPLSKDLQAEMLDRLKDTEVRV